MKYRISLKLDQIKSLILELCPLIAEKSLFDCCQHNSFSFIRIFLKFAYKIDMDRISVEFEPGQIVSLDFCPLVKKPIFDFKTVHIKSLAHLSYA